MTKLRSGTKTSYSSPKSTTTHAKKEKKGKSKSPENTSTKSVEIKVEPATKKVDGVKEEMATTPIKADPHLVFDGTDYEAWYRIIKLKIKSAGYSSTLSGPEGGSETDRARALDIIISHLPIKISARIEGENPYDFLENLTKRYKKADITKEANARSKLQVIKFSNFKSPEDYCDEVSHLAQIVW